MSLLIKLRSFLRNLFSFRSVESDLDQELYSHLELLIEENLRAGMSPQEAQRAAQIELGGLEQVKEQVRDERLANWLHSVLSDSRYALRQLRKSPAFTTVIILTLALGIGANSAIFTLVDAALLRSLPVRDPQNLFVLKWTAHNSPNIRGYYDYMLCPPTEKGKPTSRISPITDEGGKHGCSFSYPMFQQYRSLHDVFSQVAALGEDIQMDLRGNGPASIVRGELVSGDYFQTVGVETALGRTILPSDDIPGAPPVAVLGYAYWQSAFARDPTVVGKTIWLDNLPVTIVGVAAKGFPGLDPAESHDMWLPVALQETLGKDLNGNIAEDGPSIRAGDDNWWVYIVARLKPAVSPEQARSAADVLFQNDLRQQAKPLFKPNDSPRITLMRSPEAIAGLRDRFSGPLTILMAIVAIVLLIACANVAGLMLARSASRQKELAVRLALGASRSRIARQLLTESVLLSLAGGTCGIFLAYWSVRSVVALMSQGGLWPSHLPVHLDLRILLFTAFASILTGILFGLAPALRATRVDLTPALKQCSATSFSDGPRRRWLNLGGSLVIAQVTLSILVLTGAGLLVRTLQNLKSIDPGFDTRNLLIFRINPTLNGYDDVRTRSLYSELQDRLAALPAVQSVSYSFDPLLSGNAWGQSVQVEGQTQITQAMLVGPNFFENLHIPILAGRSLTAADFSPPPDSTFTPIVVNQEFVHRFFKNLNPVGRNIGGMEDHGAKSVIVGIVADAKNKTWRSEFWPMVYLPQLHGSTTFQVRTTAAPTTIVPAVRSVVSQLDENIPLYGIQTQSEMIDQSLFQARLIARLSGFFAALSLILASVGLYGLLSYEVARRTSEIGLRMALGARPRDVLRFLIAQGILLSSAGIVIGVAAATALTRYLASLLYQVHPLDPFTFIGVAALLLLVALFACYLPARRAMGVDPMIALRHE